MVSAVEPALAPDPVEALVARLDDPAVADSLHSLLDHADLLAILLVGLNDLISRGDTITDSLAEAAGELRDAEQPAFVDVGQLVTAARRLGGMAPALVDQLAVFGTLLGSDLADPRVIDIAATASRAIVRGAEQAQATQAKVSGVRALLHVLKDEDVSRALGFVVAIAKALGQELKSPPTANAGARP